MLNAIMYDTHLKTPILYMLQIILILAISTSFSIVEAKCTVQCDCYDSTGVISIKSRFWGIYQYNGKRLYMQDYKQLYKEAVEPSFLKDYKISNLLKWGSYICFAVAIVGLKYNEGGTPAYIGIPFVLASYEIPYLIGKHKFESTIWRYNSHIINCKLKKACEE